ncbi:hypothetical protein LTR62_004473 [Meristemomyces frigidus]|uniref:N-acetylglucosamine-6-phosphate deacetylase n=1 Tax=Meristemomyces frigidus TaxID=1508187 RepID=A0AAN7YRD1_9PEZI|nr:hypothetical protein LTR62_004473 [Meristemomyces frigidus]
MQIVLTHARLCCQGQLIHEDLCIDAATGLMVDGPRHADAEIIDMKGAIISPGFLELQTNGLRGFHFTHLDDKDSYQKKLEDVCKYLPQTGCTGFYPTIPTIHSDQFKKILPSLAPQDIADGASILGAHCEGPYLHPSKKGAHNSALFHSPQTPPEDIYGSTAKSNGIIKIVTLAPELQGTSHLVSHLTSNSIRVSLGHSSATYQQGLEAVKAGATCLTHTLNAMAPLHHRDPGLAGLVTASSADAVESPFFSLIADGNHLHPSVATMLFRSNPAKAILITDSIELAGLPDGTYPGHAQIPFNQTKLGTKVVIEGTETLIGGCAGLDECVRNLMWWSECGIAEAARCVTENVAGLMGIEDRGKLEVGRRADLVVLDDGGVVRETWVRGRRVWVK